MSKIPSLALAGLCILSAAHATLVHEKFSTDPALHGWQIFGDASLFQWNSASNNLAVTWDSSQTNSYFYHPLGATFTKADGFCVLFELNLTNATATGYFELAIGLCNLAEATSDGFSRGNFNSPNLLEFDYFPTGPESYGPSIDATLIDKDSHLFFADDATQPLANGVTYRVVLIHRAGESLFSGTIYTNGQVFTSLPDQYNNGTDDFRLDTLTISSYTTTDDPADSLFAQGTVANLAFASPLPVDKVKTVAPGQIQFMSDTNWLYFLEQSADLKTWSPAAPASVGNGTNLVLQATNQPAGQSFYRVRADLP